jgi:spore photoproduct lyase
MEEIKAAKNIPAYLDQIQAIWVDEAVKSSTLTKRVLSRLNDLPVHFISEHDSLPHPIENATVLYLKDYKGKFVRFCPGTSNYRCCGYRILHIGENCPFSCSYCILQAYFQDRVLKVWANQEDLLQELGTMLDAHPQTKYRIGTGEFTDSLALEPLTSYSRDIIEFLSGYFNVCLELKSKGNDLSWVDAVQDPRKVLPAWSLNSPEVHAFEEKGSASLEQRLQAARECVEKGFRVCLHFDPILYYPGWEEGYAQIIDMIFDYLSAESIAYLSLGSFRCMPQLKEFIERHYPQCTYIYAEFISGLDAKMRLLRPLRVKQFRFLVNRLQKWGLKEQLYLCMESDEVWQEVFGYTPKDLGGLAKHLLQQAFKE